MDSEVQCGSVRLTDVQDTMNLGGGNNYGDEATAFHVVPRNMQFGVTMDSQEE